MVHTTNFSRKKACTQNCGGFNRAYSSRRQLISKNTRHGLKATSSRPGLVFFPDLYFCILDTAHEPARISKEKNLEETTDVSQTACRPCGFLCSCTPTRRPRGEDTGRSIRHQSLTSRSKLRRKNEGCG